MSFPPLHATVGPHTATSQPCLYNYTIGTTFEVLITQSAPVCLICSNTAYDTWRVHTIGTTPSPIPSAPYILYVTSPIATFIDVPLVTCSAAGATSLYSIGKCIIGLILLMGTIMHVTFSSHSGHSCFSGLSSCDLCE